MTHFTLKRVPAVVGAAMLLHGCASTPPPPAVPDNSPLLNGSIVTSKITSNGLKGQFASKTVQVRKTVGTNQRMDSTTEYTGAILSRVTPKQKTSEIVRLDKNVEWILLHDQKSYFECKPGNCIAQLAPGGVLSQKNGSQSGAGSTPSETEGSGVEAACPLTLAKNDFVVTETGAQRDVNGFPANEYKVDWTIIQTDPEGREALNSISMAIWTTPESGNLAEAIALQNRFDEAYSKARSEDIPEELARAAPGEAMNYLGQLLLDNMSESDRQKIEAGALKIKGFPISQTFQWDAKNETCPELIAAAPEQEEELNTSSLSGLLKSVRKKVVKQEVDKVKEAKTREIALQPITRITEEIVSIELTGIRESQLSPPANYTIVKR